MLYIAEADAGVLAYMYHFRFSLRLAQGRAILSLHTERSQRLALD